MKDRSWIGNARIIELTHGSTYTDDQFKRNLERMRPDAIMGIGCTHDGVVNYDSRIGPNRGPEATERTVRRIEIAHSLGIKVIATHSGVGNRAAGDAHPEWIRIMADGNPSPVNRAGWQMDLLSDYPERWFLAQVEEMLRDYDADGLWVDGDCWYLRPSYSKATIDAFVEQTGYEPPQIDESAWEMAAPTSSTSFARDIFEGFPEVNRDQWREWMRFTREVFWDFQRKTGELCHRYGCIYASNGTHSVDSGPMPVPEWMDLLSHDIPGYESSGSFMASLKARFNGTQGVPHDVMTWDFNSRNPWARPDPIQVYPKGEKQYLAEVCSAVANGAMWDHWTTRAHNGAAWKVADYLRKRDYLFGSESAADVAVLHSASSFFENNGGFLITRPGNHPVWGAAQALWESGYAFDVVSEYNLERLVPKYRLIVLANQTVLSEATIALLERFVEEGGRLLVAGRSGISGDRQAFAKVLGIEERVETAKESIVTFPADPEIMHLEAPEDSDAFVLSVQSEWHSVSPAGCVVEIGAMNAVSSGPPDARGPVGWLWRGHGTVENKDAPVLTSNKSGKGVGWYLAVDLFGHYYRTQYYGVRNLISDVVNRALPSPAAIARGSLPVECALRRRGVYTFCHLVNINTVSRNNRIETQVEHLPVVEDATVALRTAAGPAEAIDADTGAALDFDFSDGKTVIRVGRVEIMRSIRIAR